MDWVKKEANENTLKIILGKPQINNVWEKNPIRNVCKWCTHLLCSQKKCKTVELKIKCEKKEKQLLEELLNRRAEKSKRHHKVTKVKNGRVARSSKCRLLFLHIL